MEQLCEILLPILLSRMLRSFYWFATGGTIQPMHFKNIPQYTHFKDGNFFPGVYSQLQIWRGVLALVTTHQPHLSPAEMRIFIKSLSKHTKISHFKGWELFRGQIVAIYHLQSDNYLPKSLPDMELIIPDLFIFLKICHTRNTFLSNPQHIFHLPHLL